MPWIKPILTLLGAFTLLAVLASCSISQAQSPAGADLDGTAWTLVALNGNPPLAGLNVTLNFGQGQQQGQVSGSSGCNSYGGKYTTANNTLKISDVMSTLMACQRDDIMQQEREYVSAIQKAATYKIENGRLEIGDAGGQTILVFTSAGKQNP